MSILVIGCREGKLNEHPPTSTEIKTASVTVTPSPTQTQTPVPTPVIGAIYNRSGIYYQSVVLRNLQRWYKIIIPPGYHPESPTALVINLHGLGSNIEQQEFFSDMSLKANEAGFIVVYPLAGAGIWNIEAGDIGAIDVDFIRQIIIDITADVNIDRTRIYATGFSNGGGMAHRLACDLSDQIAAIAPVAGAYNHVEPCDPTRPVPIIAFHGTADRVVPIQERVHDIPQWSADWARRNGCDPAPIETHPQEMVEIHTFTNCENNATVQVYYLEGVGHTWPGAQMGDLLGPNTQGTIATDLIWDFFRTHPLRDQ